MQRNNAAASNWLLKIQRLSMVEKRGFKCKELMSVKDAMCMDATGKKYLSRTSTLQLYSFYSSCLHIYYLI